MAFDAYDDYEQSERVQKWLKQNGLSIVVGIVIGLVAIFGWQQWRSHQAGHQNQAAGIYQQVQTAAAAGNTAIADALTNALTKDYADTPYALFAMSDRARAQSEAKQFDKALVSLAWAEQHTDSPSLKGLTELRIARLQLAQGNAQQALSTLDRLPADSYVAIGQELRGDALVKLGRNDDARKAYQTALTALGAGVQQDNELQMKIDDLATAGKQGA
jgi:predicted negative regulator of RcsB-dependent stress response